MPSWHEHAFATQCVQAQCVLTRLRVVAIFALVVAPSFDVQLEENIRVKGEREREKEREREREKEREKEKERKKERKREKVRV